MICDNCSEKQANVFFTQIIGDQVKKVNLCEECSKKKGITDPTNFALAEMLSEMGGSGKKATAPAGPSARAMAEPTCPACGFGQSDFKKSGRLGCSACYLIFKSEIDGLLKNIHQGVRHIGKAPSRAVGPTLEMSKIDTLRQDLGRAIEDEQYEEAARLRDEINKLSATRPL